ncbi:hypothetical protein GGU10DRAFT_146846 [Lentinula aff. detonsa]|uniref:SET domain-containing protein n=1 Tax=Lentinula aff. detonsa TaxID=2804958 RepID=A0AA38NT58_9AGAR|nr:hypothetical protein GGU10DRAFT_146846 [Lentinula aff. detonsa]
MLSDYEDSDSDGAEPGVQHVQQPIQPIERAEADEGSSSGSDNLYESSESEREDWQDDIDPEHDWDVKVVGVEVTNGDEIHYEARWPGWSRSDGTTNTYHRKGDPNSPLKGITETRYWDDARKDRINDILRKVRDNTDGSANTALGIELWADNDVMSSNTRYNTQLFDEKLAIIEGRMKKGKALRVKYDLGGALESEMLRLLTKEIGEEDARRILTEYGDNDESDDDVEDDTDDDQESQDEDNDDQNFRRRTRSETGSSRTRSTAPSTTSNRASTSGAPSTSLGPSHSQLNTLNNVKSVSRIPQAQNSTRQVQNSTHKQLSSLKPPGRSVFFPPPPSSFGPPKSLKNHPASPAHSSSPSSTSAFPTSLASSRSAVAGSKSKGHDALPLFLPPSSSSAAASTTRTSTTPLSKTSTSASPTTTLCSEMEAPTSATSSLNSSNTISAPSSKPQPLSAMSPTSFVSSPSTISSMSTSSTSTLLFSPSVSSSKSFTPPDFNHSKWSSTTEFHSMKYEARQKPSSSLTAVRTTSSTASTISDSHSSLEPASIRSSARIRAMGTISNPGTAAVSERRSGSKLRASTDSMNLDAGQDHDMGLGQEEAKSKAQSRKKGNGKRKVRETRSRLQLLSLAWTKAAAQTGAAPVTFVNEVDDEDGPPDLGFNSNSREDEFTYLEAKPRTFLKELLNPPDADMFLRCNCGEESDQDSDVDMGMNEELHIELFGGTDSDLDSSRGKGKAREKSGSRRTTPEKSCGVSSACGCQGISELVDRYKKPARAYTEDGLFKFASRSKSGIEVIECNQYCNCTLSECSNRVAQRPRSVPIEIFKTEALTESGLDEDEDYSGSQGASTGSKRGWGVRCTAQVVKRGTVLGSYTGEIVYRQTANLLQGIHGTYVFDLDGKDPAEDNEELNENVQIYSIDARKCGNWTRFLNHSCLPNLAVYSAVWDTIPEQNIPHLVFFALEDIPKGAEMTVDYHAGIPLPREGRIHIHRPPDTNECFCGAKRCRGWV